MEPCCGLASIAGRKAARRAIFRIAMATIDVRIARIYDLIDSQVEIFGVGTLQMEELCRFGFVDLEYCESRPGL